MTPTPAPKSGKHPVLNSIINTPAPGSEATQPAVMPPVAVQYQQPEMAAKNATVPPHYDKPVQPWDLIEHMDSSGDVLVDHLRATAIEHLFRIKDDLLGDLIKTQTEITKAIARLKKKETQE